jgi:hypothetical protein
LISRIDSRLNLNGSELIRMRKVGLFFACAMLLASAPATAEQRLYRETPDGWFIYVEDRSCVMYADLPSGTMLRFSNRTDEQRVYFAAVNDDWDFLRESVGEVFTMLLSFPELQRGLGSAGGVFENPDGRFGYTAANFTSDPMFRYLSTGGRMTIDIKFGTTPMSRIETVTLRGAAMAVTHLAECTEENFPEE